MTHPARTRSSHTTVQGNIHRPGDPHYDTQRATENPAFNATPAIIVEAANPADVQATVTWARDQNLPLAIQSTGHGTHVPSDGGVLLKTSQMKTVLVDPDRRIARIGAGAIWQDVITAAAPFGLAPVSGSHASVGVAGFTMGGGLGALSRKYGLGADNLLRADLVTADGELVIATRDRNPDLFWAIRGGGGNFGVVTSMEIELHQVDEVYAGQALLPKARAADVLDRFRAYAPEMPEELTCTIAVTKEHVAVRATYLGQADAARKALEPLGVADAFDEGPVPGTAPKHFELFNELPDIDTVIEVAEEANVEVRYWGGAIARGESPAGHRNVPFSIIVDGPDAAAERLWPYATGGSFLNFLRDPSAVETAYTAADYQLLREVKACYDPANVFHRNLNIKPA